MKIEKHKCDYCGGPAGEAVPEGEVRKNKPLGVAHAWKPAEITHICKDCMEAKEL